MVERKRPARGTDWRPIPTIVTGAEAWKLGRLAVISSVSVMEAPDASKDGVMTWLVSVSRADRAMVTDKELRRVRRDFDMRRAEEDNHLDGIARDLFLVVDPARRVECECKTDETVIERPDGFKYSVPRGGVPVTLGVGGPIVGRMIETHATLEGVRGTIELDAGEATP